MPNPPVPMPLSEADYEAIEAAVMETGRGRWFLAEYARRNRHADTKMLLVAIERIEATIRGERTVESVDRIRFDLLEMAKAIARTKAEIAAIKPDADHHGKFGDATEELDSIVNATEAATSDILAAAEQIQEIAWTLREQGLEAEICDLVDTKTTDIYTACSFQDLTGQRTRKIIQVLRYLEGRINAMIDIWGLDSAMAAEADETAKARRGEAALLNGPARPGHGLDQSDIDVVMGPATAAGHAPEGRTFDATAPVIDADPPPPAPLVASAEPVPAGRHLTTYRKPVAEAEADGAALAPAARREPAFSAPARPEPPKRPETPPANPADPLAPINALSAEEKIALFS